MTPKKKNIDRFKESGKFDTLKQRLSAAFLLMNISKTYMEEAEDLCREYGLILGELKQDLTLANKYYERFTGTLRKIVDAGDPQDKLNFFDDYEKLIGIINKFIDE